MQCSLCGIIVRGRHWRVHLSAPCWRPFYRVCLSCEEADRLDYLNICTDINGPVVDWYPAIAAA